MYINQTAKRRYDRDTIKGAKADQNQRACLAPVSSKHTIKQLRLLRLQITSGNRKNNKSINTSTTAFTKNYSK